MKLIGGGRDWRDSIQDKSLVFVVTPLESLKGKYWKKKKLSKMNPRGSLGKQFLRHRSWPESLFIKALVKTFASDSFWQGFSLPNNPLSHPVRKKEENQSRQWRETQFFYDLIIQQRRKKIIDRLGKYPKESLILISVFWHSPIC